MTIWEDLYTDLSPATAAALREARVKPEQLATMADGEIMAIAGMSDAGLEQVRSIYMADINATPKSEVPVTDEAAAPAVTDEPGVIPPNKRHDFKNGKAIVAAKSKVDRTKLYSVAEAVKLVKATNITKFDSTVTLHLNLNPKEKLTRAEVTFPHMAGTAKRVAIVSDELLKDIEAGKTVIKAEPKFPLMHVTVGKVSQPEAELVANIQAALDAVKAKNMVKATLASTMSPGIKLQLS